MGCERKREREERVADVATGATWTGNVAENRDGFGLGGVICTVSCSFFLREFPQGLSIHGTKETRNNLLAKKFLCVRW